MRNFVNSLFEKARKNPGRIVYPESSDERILNAVVEVVKLGIAHPILLGDQKQVFKKMGSMGLPTEGIDIIDPLKSDKLPKYAQEFYTIRKDHGMTLDQARKMIELENYFGTMMVHMGDADGLIYGALHPTADTLRPALQIIKTKGHFHKVSGVFFMIFKDRLMLFADAAVEPDPDAKDLADVALDTAQTAKKFDIVPKVAMLSFSTKGSAKHPMVEKVIEATKIAAYKDPSLLIDGELQLDAAIEPWVAEIKCPNSKLKGEANILIFPELNAANIGYKLATFFGKADAVGPVLQGLNKPVNDLSRGCTVKDIVEITAVTVIEGQK
ncbi:MAG: phosphate acetyltransferase [Nanoarchaeota archaeon]|nr:phosphate acetyltransferase [Nanoarchaeota archaeon]MBU1704363.1 phosphate acetyltransferase [Nanoarchaeota archaeon]